MYHVALRLGLAHSLPSFVPLWAASDRIYVGPAGPGATVFPELLALRIVIANAAISDDQIRAFLSHPNPFVVGYCFEALLARRSTLLTLLPASLQTRNEEVSMGITSFDCTQPLHNYIAHRFLNAFHHEPKFDTPV
ncbi:MAG: hypothetical protein EOP84_11330 [Verrucomicrobiaceae bacterium]|nr:MAG: hypothetical protein EOP84_11330 [Verrucomicrobiaceae bacterium]